ncbi:osmoprotectant NAGGN system M42 family peptidase [Allosphingosinicella indica]|uniref:Hydrolase, peptidase M42 family n=1 Tax=Allosphingosinicella indica TaxID=941907 RepID=A0A1X7GG70_9SPHN|nr:osmoprotectant NAGGN system M42 family peptidase [Allosphingosinicella indica]SMF69339.1 hydrolase, peptidase M42 family [Allosphingosinicella indica]
MTFPEIDPEYLKAQLAALLAIPSPTGYTDNVVRHVTEELARIGMGHQVTRRGAILACYKGKQTEGARAIVAHLDTLGATVKRIKETGRLELVPIGTWAARAAEYCRCTIYTDDGSLRGTILPLKASGHTFNDEVDTQPAGWPHVEVRVDAESFNQAEAAALGLRIGDFVAIDTGTEFLDNGFIVSRQLDDKAGCAAMMAAMKAMQDAGVETPVDIHFIFTIAEEVGSGASSVLLDDVAAMVSIDNGTTAEGQNSSEFGVTICMADQVGPFDYHLTRKLIRLCEEGGIRHQRDVFRYYRSDSASALEGGADVRTALITFGVDASHGYERIHLHALTSIAELTVRYAMSAVEIGRDAAELADMHGFTSQPSDPAPMADAVPQGD